MSVDTSEVRALLVDLLVAGPKSRRESMLAVQNGEHETVRLARSLAPNRTGTLAASIKSRYFGLAFDAGPTAFYGSYIEYGTGGPYNIPHVFGGGGSGTHPGITPQPFMGPALELAVQGIEDDFGDIGERAIT